MKKYLKIDEYKLNNLSLCNYFNKFKRTHLIFKMRTLCLNGKDKSFFSNSKKFSICGRIFRKRIMGKVMFLDLKDISGSIQLYLSKKNLDLIYNKLILHLKLGDIIAAEGFLFCTKTNELSLNVLFFKILSKNFNSFPDKRFGLVDKESCYRQRYVDLMVNDDTKKRFILRSKLISKIRKFFIKDNFLEVETPIIQIISGGADAKPFETYHNYLDSKLYLRIAPELYLKRLIVGGFEKVFEIGKNFRNEGVSTRHHPEFTMIEFYQAYADYKDLMYLTEKLFKYLVNSFFSVNSFIYNNILLDFSSDFNRIDFLDSILKYSNFSRDNLFNRDFMIDVLKKHQLIVTESLSVGELQFKLFEYFVEKKLLQPTFVLHHPVDVSPLARTMENNKTMVERFELYICGREIANGFSELNDPNEQILRFSKQLLNKDKNDIDKDFINALKYGLPPTAGEGIGIDRVVMLFANAMSIKDVILFPLMKLK